MGDTANTLGSIATIVLDVSLDKPLDYAIPPELQGKIMPGMRVEVPLRGSLQFGYVTEIKNTSSFPKLSSIQRLLHDKPLLDEPLMKLAEWMSTYYCTPFRQVLKILVPSPLRKEIKPRQQLYVMRGKTREQLAEVCIELRQKSSAQADVLDVMLQVKKGLFLTELLEETGGSRSPVDTLAAKGLLLVESVKVDRSPLVNEEYFKTKPKQLNACQAQAFEKILRTLNAGAFQTHLLFGITGSGKTEIYLQAIDRALELGKGTIMLVPEISLTPQTVERFRSRFNEHIAVLHHRLSAGERFDEWHRIRNGQAQIVIGARSAIFSPVQNLGLIIVDEEHENSYKQSEEMPCYNARDVAVMRGKMAEATVILGSATPSLESYRNAKIGKYELSELNVRAEKSLLPTTTIVDMKKEYEKHKGFTNFSDPLISGIKARVENGEQVILFLNRRGYHTTMICQDCGTPVKCTHCDVCLTHHLKENALQCHLCGFLLKPPPSQCPTCHATAVMKYKGVGTEQIEKGLHAVLPGIRTMRVDADTTRHKGSHQRLLREFGTGKADVLIGTQMIAKGLHFPQVTLVGILNADAALQIPDFRASENAFQLMTQVAGRAGRGVTAGEVIIQTLMPDNETIQFAAKQDYCAYYHSEMGVREFFHYPPLSQMVKFILSGKDEKKVRDFIQRLHDFFKRRLPPTFTLLSPQPCSHAKVKDVFRFQFLISGPTVTPIATAVRELQGQAKPFLPSGLRWCVDVNPLST